MYSYQTGHVLLMNKDIDTHLARENVAEVVSQRTEWPTGIISTLQLHFEHVLRQVKVYPFSRLTHQAGNHSGVVDRADARYSQGAQTLWLLEVSLSAERALAQRISKHLYRCDV